jgi:hypothetical protein
MPTPNSYLYFVHRLFINILNEKTFRDCGSRFLNMPVTFGKIEDIQVGQIFDSRESLAKAKKSIEQKIIKVLTLKVN